MTGEMQPWQLLLPKSADMFPREVRLGTNHDVHVPVPLAPLVDDEVFEIRPETAETIPHPPQELLEG